MFLKPLPGERPHGGEGPYSSPDAGQAPADGHENVLRLLFPADADGPGSDASPGSVLGVTLGHFQLEERIGRGGMGAVFRALDTRLERVVALKVLSPQHCRDGAAVQRFHNEARAAAHLDHENIARVHYIGEDRGVHYIAFEFVRGTNVRDFILQKGALGPADAVNYTLQIAQALRHTQAAGVVHRDIKPSNIIVTPSGRAKLVDLGLARQERADQSHELTTASTTLGTFDYIAPEQARDPRRVDVRADIYSLGCTLYHMLTGEPPFPQGGMIQKVVDHHRDDPPDPAARNPRVSPQLSRIVRKMMASNPDERYAAPDHLIYDLAQVAHALGLRPVQTDQVIWTAPLFEKPSLLSAQNRGWLLTVALLLLIAAGINVLPRHWITGVGDDSRAPASADNTQSVRPGSAPAVEPEAAPPRPDEPAAVGGFAAGVAGFEPAPIESGRLLIASALRRPGSAEVGSTSAANTGSSGGASGRSAADLETQRLLDDINAVTSIPGGALSPAATGRPAAASPFAVIAANGTERPFQSLEAACQEALTDDIIELRFDGPCPQPQAPVRIQGKRLVIRAEQGKRPLLEFRAAAAPGMNAVTRMISVSDGSLKLYDVDLVLDVNGGGAVVTDRWCLFSLSRVDAFDLQRVSVTLRNADRRAAAIVEQVAPPNRDAFATMPSSMMRRRLAMNWRQSLFRGDCDVLVSETLDPTDILLDNVAVAVGGTLLRVPGGKDPGDMRMGSDAACALALQHVTALLGEGALRLDTTDVDREFLPLQFDWQDSVVAVAPRQALLSMAGHHDSATFKNRLEWDMVSTWFDLDGPVWEVFPESDVYLTDLDFRELGYFSEAPIVRDVLERPVVWGAVRFDTVDARELRLRNQPRRPQATDGLEAGVRWEGLPEFGLARSPAGLD